MKIDGRQQSGAQRKPGDRDHGQGGGRSGPGRPASLFPRSAPGRDRQQDQAADEKRQRGRVDQEVPGGGHVVDGGPAVDLSQRVHGDRRAVDRRVDSHERADAAQQSHERPGEIVAPRRLCRIGLDHQPLSEEHYARLHCSPTERLRPAARKPHQLEPQAEGDPQRGRPKRPRRQPGGRQEHHQRDGDLAACGEPGWPGGQEDRAQHDRRRPERPVGRMVASRPEKPRDGQQGQSDPRPLHRATSSIVICSRGSPKTASSSGGLREALGESTSASSAAGSALERALAGGSQSS